MSKLYKLFRLMHTNMKTYFRALNVSFGKIICSRRIILCICSQYVMSIIYCNLRKQITCAECQVCDACKAQFIACTFIMPLTVRFLGCMSKTIFPSVLQLHVHKCQHVLHAYFRTRVRAQCSHDEYGRLQHVKHTHKCLYAHILQKCLTERKTLHLKCAKLLF